MYANGLGVEKNITKTLALYNQVADQGVAAAQYNLGIYMRKGVA